MALFLDKEFHRAFSRSFTELFFTEGTEVFTEPACPYGTVLVRLRQEHSAAEPKIISRYDAKNATYWALLCVVAALPD
jgi:hypothetical protein